MVVNIGWVKDGKYQEIEDEIRQIHEACGGKILKVIIETCLLTEEEKIRMCETVTSAGAEFIKTSTGFSTAGATFADVELMRKHVGNGLVWQFGGDSPGYRLSPGTGKTAGSFQRTGTQPVVFVKFYFYY